MNNEEFYEKNAIPPCYDSFKEMRDSFWIYFNILFKGNKKIIENEKCCYLGINECILRIDFDEAFWEINIVVENHFLFTYCGKKLFECFFDRAVSKDKIAKKMIAWYEALKFRIDEKTDNDFKIFEKES